MRKTLYWFLRIIMLAPLWLVIIGSWLPYAIVTGIFTGAITAAERLDRRIGRWMRRREVS